MEDFSFNRLGGFGWRSPRDVVGRICPECHSNSSREERRREHRKRTEEEDEKDIRKSGYQDVDIRVSKYQVAVLGTPPQGVPEWTYGDKYSAICGCFFVELDRLM